MPDLDLRLACATFVCGWCWRAVYARVWVKSQQMAFVAVVEVSGREAALREDYC